MSTGSYPTVSVRYSFAYALTAPSAGAGGWAGKGETGSPVSTQGVDGALGSKPAPHSVASPALPSDMPTTTAEAQLHWPRAFADTPGEIGLALRHLAGLPAATQQAILDEIVFIEHHAKREVRNRMGLLRTLSKRARIGEFTPEGAHRVAELRAARLVRERPEVAVGERAQPPEAQRPKAALSEETRQRLADLSDKVKRRAAG